MATLASLATNPFYSKGLNLDGSDFILNKNTELWIAELSYGEKVPAIATLTVGAAAVSADDISIDITSDVDIDLKRGDTVYFPTGDVLAVLSADVSFAASVESPMPVRPLEGAIASAETATKYVGMLPVYSLQDGGTFTGSGTSATARNRVQKMWPARQIVERDGQMNIAGSYYRKDISAAKMRKVFIERNSNFYIEIRNAPFVEDIDENGSPLIRGMGSATVAGQFVLLKADVDTSASTEFQSFNADFEIASQISSYRPRGL